MKFLVTIRTHNFKFLILDITWKIKNTLNMAITEIFNGLMYVATFLL